jgi:methylsterol monooxygenase
MSFVMHELVYFGRSLMWIIIDQIPYFKKFKIQEVSRARIQLLQPKDMR